MDNITPPRTAPRKAKAVDYILALSVVAVGTLSALIALATRAHGV